MKQEIYNKFKYPDIVTVIIMQIGMTWACCKSDWRKEANRKEKEKKGKLR